VHEIEKAIIYAARAHDKQFRKGGDVPYITHPFAVALILQRQGCSKEVVIAGLLHDTIEDTPVTLGDIEREFGSKVAALVKGCSEPDRSASWEIRKQHTIDYVRTAPYDIKLVVCADKLHNISCVLREYKEIGVRVWERFHRGYEQQKWYHTSMVDSLFFGLNGVAEGSIFHQYREKVAELFVRNLEEF